MTPTSTRAFESQISKLMGLAFLLNVPFAIPTAAATTESLVITAPTPGQVFSQNSSLRLSWDSTGLTGDVEIRIYVGDYWTALPPVPVSNGSCTYYISNSEMWSGSRYDLLDREGGTSLVTLDFSKKTNISMSILAPGSGATSKWAQADTGFFTVEPPSVEILQPTQGDVFRVGDLLRVRWKTSGLNYPHVAMSISDDNGATWTKAGFYFDDTGSFNLRVARDFGGDETRCELDSPNSNDDFTLTYFEKLKFAHSYKIRLNAGASTGYDELEGTFSILPPGAENVSRQIIKATVGRRLHVKIQGLSGVTSYRGKMPRGLQYKKTSRWVVGRAKHQGRRIVKFSDQQGGVTIVKFRIRASHAGPRY